MAMDGTLPPQHTDLAHLLAVGIRDRELDLVRYRLGLLGLRNLR